VDFGIHDIIRTAHFCKNEMLTLTITTTKEKKKIYCPQRMDELSVDQLQRILREWDGEDWIQLFCILSGMEADAVSESKDGRLEGTLYECIEFIFLKAQWAALVDTKIPDYLELRPIWQKDCPLIVDSIKIPKHIGRLSIGQAIQARKSLEDAKSRQLHSMWFYDNVSIITAIYLQPLIDNSKFDMLRAIEIEQIILKMPATKIYPIGFFLLRKLTGNGSLLTRLLNLMKNFLRMKSVKR
jgi:hypothetical protein